MSPIISQIARERRAVVIIERRSVILSADTIDITAEVIARINAAIGDDSQPPQETTPDVNQQDDTSGQNSSDE